MSLTGFLWKHRGKLLVLTVAVVTASVGYYLVASESPLNIASEVLADSNDEEEKKRQKQLKTSKLTKINQLFESSLSKLLPLLKLKVTEVVDVMNTIRKVKELRNNPDLRLQNGDAEHFLWEDIKIQSFTLWFTSIYCSSALIVLLKTQLFILSRDNSSLVELSSRFDLLIIEAYQTILEKGVENISNNFRDHFRHSLAEWTVKNKGSVSYEEFSTVVTAARNFVESDLKNLIVSMIIPSTEKLKTDTTNYEESKDDIKSSLFTENEEVKQSNEGTDFYESHFSELWDVVESPIFGSAFHEACTICFSRHMAVLRLDMFPPLDPSSINDPALEALSSPPLASLLPQLKSLATTMLPSSGVSFDAKEMSRGAVLHQLCLSLIGMTEDGVN